MYPQIPKDAHAFLSFLHKNIEVLLCDPEGKVVMAGSQKDRDLMQTYLDNLKDFLLAQNYSG